MNTEVLNTSDLLRSSARARPTRTMIIEAERRISYAQFDAQVDRLAAWFIGQGLSHGFRAAYLLNNQWEVLLAYHAIGRAGGIVVAINARLTPDEIAFQLNEAAVDAVVFDAEFEDLLSRALARSDRTMRLVSCGRAVPLASDTVEAILEHCSPLRPGAYPRLAPEDDSGIWFTSGTTGTPKGAVVTHRSSVFAALLTAGVARVGAQTRLLSAAPMFHRGAIEDVHLAVTLMGGTHILARRFDPENTLRLIEKERATYAFIVPTMAHMMLDVPRRGAYDLGSLQCWMSASAPLREDLQQRIRSDFHLRRDVLQNAYGITESLMNTWCDGQDLIERPGSAGRPVPLTSIRISDDDGRCLPAGKVGEILISGPSQFRTYLGRPEDYDAVTVHADGALWYRSGDLGYLDDDGFLHIVDRSKDMILSGGENVYSVEVEMALTSCPAVAEVAVVGQPDDKWGERVVAFVVLKAGHQATEADLAAACASISDYKRPKVYRCVEALPRNSFGKVQKAQLRALLNSAAA